MSKNCAQKAVVILILFTLFFLFSSCGELGTLIPSNESYKVKTLVNGSPIEDCSIIRSNDKIHPSFASSVVGDPDLIGLLIYLQDDQGEIIGEPIRYILKEYAEGPVPEETELTELPEEGPAPEQNEETDDEIYIEPEPEAETQAEGPMIWELPEYGAIRPVADVRTAAVTIIGVEVAVRSLDRELPYFSFPKALETGAYTLVFEAIGKGETLYRMETDIFYLGSVEFNLKDISMSLPGLSGTQLISPGTTVMLEARLDFDRRFDPYVIWYNGKNIISEGKLNNDAGILLWKAPEQAGFYSLRLEVLPFRRLKRSFTGLTREIALPVSPKALSLGYFFEDDFTGRSPLAAGTVYPEQIRLIMEQEADDSNDSDDSDSEEEAPVIPAAPELLRWYQFAGGLTDSVSEPYEAESLAPLNKQPPRWASAAQTYGLCVEADDIYQFTPVNFFRTEKDQGGGIFLLHIRPPSEGAILSALFPYQTSAAAGVRINIIKKGSVITLRMSAGASSLELPIDSNSSGLSGFIPIVVEFYILPDRLDAKISLGNEYHLQSDVGRLRLSDALSGDAAIRLGDIMEKTEIIKPETTDDEDIPPFSPNTIWDEFAVLFSEAAFPPPLSIIESDIEDEKKENEDMDDENAGADGLIQEEEEDDDDDGNEEDDDDGDDDDPVPPHSFENQIIN